MVRPAEIKRNFGWVWPVVITLFWFGIVGWYLSLPLEKEGKTLFWFAKIAALDPNNFGDFLSGAFAPVAFFWLAYSVWIQKSELQETRDVLAKQQIELEKSSSASNKILDVNLRNLRIEYIEHSHNMLRNLINNYYESTRLFQGIKIYLSDGTKMSIEFFKTYNNSIERPATGLEIAHSANKINETASSIGAEIQSDANIDRLERINDIIDQILRVPDEENDDHYSMAVMVDALEFRIAHEAIAKLIAKARSTQK